MLPGRRKPFKRKHFLRGLRCGIIGCPFRASHQWAYPCAITTDAENPKPPRWLPVCHSCDLRLNKVLLETVGIPHGVLDDLLTRYQAIQADAAFDA